MKANLMKSFFKKQMKKYFNLFFVICICSLALFSCETDGDFENTSYKSYSFSFFYPKDITDYEYVFNGQKGASGIVSINEPEGLLEIYKKDSDTPLFSQQISLTEQSNNIQFIQLGDNITIYNPEKIISFTPTIIFSGNELDYSVWFNGQKLQNRELNYLSIDKQTGLFEIMKSDEVNPVFSMEMTIANNDKINMMQLSESDFLDIPEDTEPVPTEDNKCKVRFYYPNGIFDAETIRIDLYGMDLYQWDWVSEMPHVGSVTVEKGKISDYVELSYLIDGSGLVAYFYSITNVATDEKYIDYMNSQIYMGVPETPCGDGVSVVFKKVTYQLEGSGDTFNVLESLTVRR